MGNYSKIRIYERDFKTDSGCPSDLVQKGNSTVIGYYREDAMSDYQITNTPDLPIDKQGNFDDDWRGPVEILTFRCTSSKMMLIKLLLLTHSLHIYMIIILRHKYGLNCFSFAYCALADARWTEWGEWSECSTGCRKEEGVISRNHSCVFPDPNNKGHDCICDKKLNISTCDDEIQTDECDKSNCSCK